MDGSTTARIGGIVNIIHRPRSPPVKQPVNLAWPDQDDPILDQLDNLV
jgi:hypothetical protein